MLDAAEGHEHGMASAPLPPARSATSQGSVRQHRGEICTRDAVLQERRRGVEEHEANLLLEGEPDEILARPLGRKRTIRVSTPLSASAAPPWFRRAAADQRPAVVEEPGEDHLARGTVEPACRRAR